MLLEQARPGAGGRVGVQTRNRTFTRLLEAILADWHLGADPAGGYDILLVERGLVPPTAAQRVVWLSPLPLGIEPHIEVPLSLVELYHYLEQLFFPQPRRHIRLPLDQPLDLNVRGVWLVGRMVSLSDRGARIVSPAKLPRGETLQLEFKLGSYPLSLTADVLYEIPAGDAPGREQPQAGVLFRQLRPALRQSLRHFIEKNYVERACKRTGIAENDPSLSWFELVDNPWGGLS